MVSFTRAADGSSPGGIVSFRKDDPSRRVEQNNAICLGCHERGERTYWSGSTHETRGVACTECHTVMRQVSRKSALKTVVEMETCFQCHKDRRAQIFRSSHMPLREGKMTCTELSQSARQRHGSDAEGKFDQRQLLQVPCRKARTIPVRACARAGELPELSRPARQQHRIHAESVKAAAVCRMSWLRSRVSDQRAARAWRRSDVRARTVTPSSRKQQSVGGVASEVDAVKVE